MRALMILFAGLMLIASTGREATAAGSAAFCNTWQDVCNKTCPGGAGTCKGTCSSRYKDCLSSGCFFFNVPGPRCQGNSKDDTATKGARKTMREGGAVGCGPGFGNRPCE